MVPSPPPRTPECSGVFSLDAPPHRVWAQGTHKLVPEPEPATFNTCWYPESTQAAQSISEQGADLSDLWSVDPVPSQVFTLEYPPFRKPVWKQFCSDTTTLDKNQGLWDKETKVMVGKSLKSDFRGDLRMTMWINRLFVILLLQLLKITSTWPEHAMLQPPDYTQQGIKALRFTLSKNW